MNDRPNSIVAAELRERNVLGVENYKQLYDFAPIAYYTLNAQGVILRTNLRGAVLLGEDYSLLGNISFVNCVAYAYQAEFKRFLTQVFAGSKVQTCTLRLQSSVSMQWVNIKAIADKDKKLCVMTVVDITEQQQLIGQLQCSENLTRAIIDSLSGPIAVLDEFGNIMQTNQAWRQFARENGGSVEYEQGLGQNYFAVCRQAAAEAPEAEEILNAMQEVLNGDRLQYVMEYPCNTPDNKRWFKLEVLPLIGARGLVTHHIDLSERKNMEAALQEKERFLTDSQAVAHIGSWMLDIKSSQVYWSEETFRLFGFSPETKLAPGWAEFLNLLHPEDRPAMQAWFDSCLAGKNPADIEYRTCPANGAPRWLQGRGKLETGADGEPLRMLGTIQDISEQKAATTALLSSEARFRNYFNLNMIGIAITSEQKEWLEINDRLCDILGYTREELKHRTWVDITHPDDLESGLTLYEQLLAGKIDNYALEKRYIKKDGGVVYISLAGSCIRRADGGVDHFVALIEDITARKRAECELLESQAKYQKLLQHVESIREQERTRISREIHDDLGSFLAALKLDLSWLDKNLESNIQHCRNKIRTMTHHIDSGLKAVKRIINNLRPSILDQFGLLPAIEWTVEDLRERSNIDCRLMLPEQEITLDVDKSNAVFRITQETFTNILKHADASQIRVTLEIDDNNLLMTITDNGCGLALKPKNTPLTYGIIGMQERARHFGGDLNVSSQAGAGTTMRLSMPLTNTSKENPND